MGEESCVWCFLHIVNLITKAIICQFDASKGRLETEEDEEDDEDVDKVDNGGGDNDDDDDDDDNDNNDDGDDDNGISVSIQLVWVVLNKVCLCHTFCFLLMSADMFIVEICKISFVVKNSSTLILPEWKNILGCLNLASWMIPHDVKTWWNSTYDMLEVVVQYCSVINELTANQRFALQDYEMSLEDWKIAAQLCKVLQVSIVYSILYCAFSTCPGFQERNHNIFKIRI